MTPKRLKPIQTALLFLPEIKELCAKRRLTELQEILHDLSPFDISDIWGYLGEEEKLIFFRLLRPKQAVKVFEMLHIEDQKFLLNTLEEDVTRRFLSDVDAPDLVQVFQELPPKMVRKLFSILRREDTLEHVQDALQFPENTAGSLMDTKFLALKVSQTVQQALRTLKASAHLSPEDLLVDLYVTDNKGNLMGRVSLGELLRASSNMRLREMIHPVHRLQVNALADQEEVAERFRRFDLFSCPVVNNEGRLLGVVTADRIFDVVQEEATEDLLKISGTGAETLEARSMFQEIHQRLPWLAAAMGGQMAVSLVVKHFNPVLAKIVALATFMPLIAAMGGNLGAQSSVLVIRGLATGRINPRRWFPILLRHAFSGAAMGLLYGLLLGAFAWMLYNHQLDSRFGLVVSASAFINMTLASTFGAALPFLLSRLRIDPAGASQPLITTLTDLLGVSLYFSLAWWILL